MSVELSADGQALALQQVLQRLPDVLDDPAQLAWTKDQLQHLLELVRNFGSIVFRYLGRADLDYMFEVGPYGHTRTVRTRRCGLRLLHDLVHRYELERHGTPMPPLYASKLAGGSDPVGAVRKRLRETRPVLETWGARELISIAATTTVSDAGLLAIRPSASAPRFITR